MHSTARRNFLSLGLVLASGCATVGSWADRLTADPLAAFTTVADAINRAVTMARSAFVLAAARVPALAARQAEFEALVVKVLHGVDVAREILRAATRLDEGRVYEALSLAYDALQELHVFLSEIGAELPLPLGGVRGRVSLPPERVAQRDALAAIRRALPPRRAAALPSIR